MFFNLKVKISVFEGCFQGLISLVFNEKRIGFYMKCKSIVDGYCKHLNHHRKIFCVYLRVYTYIKRETYGSDVNICDKLVM